ncbi:MAG: histidinol-phosphate transaminase [Woeseiaceae bacterium]|nr:histidinol-phosphate transaminase [Woeseiaceae bacterium]
MISKILTVNHIKGNAMKLSKDTQKTQKPYSRRSFIAASAGIGSLSLSANLGLAETITSSMRPISVEELHGWGEVPGVADIGDNENPFGPSPRALRAINERIMDVNRYDFGSYRKLETAVGEHLNLAKEEVNFPPGRARFAASGYPVYVEGGSSFILSQIAMIYGVKNGAGEIIEIDPGYAGVSRAAMSFRARFGTEIEIKNVPATTELKHDLGAMLKAISDKTTLIVITNPNNPTGTILPYDEIRRFVDAVPENIMVLIDEAYIHFVREENYQTAVKLSQEYKNVIVTRTFSKMYGMAGLRVGYAVGHKSIMSELRAAGNSGGIGSINCYAAIAALKDTAFVRHVKRLTNASKDYFYQELENLGLSYVPSHSSFVMVNVNQNGQALRQKLLARNIKVRTYGSSIIKNYIRFSIGTLDEMQATVGVLTDEIKG